MSKRAVSVTLEADNLLWLRGQARATGRISLSQLLDQLVTEARAAGHVHDAAVRSVAGTVRIAATDPELATADEAIRSLFGLPRHSLSGPGRPHTVTRRQRVGDR